MTPTALRKLTLKADRAAARIRSSPTARFAPGRLVPAGVTVLATPVLTRLLSTEDFGDLAVYQTTALLFGAAMFGWVEVLVVRTFAAEVSVRDERLAELLTPALIGSLVIVALASLVSATDHSGFPVLVAFCAVTYGCTLAATALMRAQTDATGFVIAANVGFAGRFVVGVPLVAAGVGIAGVLLAWVMSGAVALVFVLKRLRVGRAAFRPTRPPRDDVDFAVPLLGVSSGLLALALADRLILSLHLSAADVAPYALGYSLVDQMASLMFSIMLAAAFPAMIRTYETEGAARARQDLQAAMSRFVRVAVPPLLLLAVFGADIARTFGGPKYRDADFGFMPWVAAGLLFQGLSQYLSVPQQQQGNTRLWARAVGIGVFVNVSLNVALDGWVGTLGAGIATTFGYGSVMFVLWWTGRHAITLPRRELAVQSFAIASVTGIAVFTAEGLPTGSHLVLCLGAYPLSVSIGRIAARAT